jgi:hypothetical protein
MGYLIRPTDRITNDERLKRTSLINFFEIVNAHDRLLRMILGIVQLISAKGKVGAPI